MVAWLDGSDRYMERYADGWLADKQTARRIAKQTKYFFCAPKQTEAGTDTGGDNGPSRTHTSPLHFHGNPSMEAWNKDLVSNSPVFITTAPQIQIFN